VEQRIVPEFRNCERNFCSCLIEEEEEEEEGASFLNHDFSTFDRFPFSLLQRHLIII
jgi:hypothetical protein